MARRQGRAVAGAGRSARLGRLAEHEPVAVGRAKPEFAHSPRLVAGGLQHLGARGEGVAVELVNVIDVEIRHGAVVAELAAQYVAVPGTGSVQVMDGENRVGSRDPHVSRMTWERLMRGGLRPGDMSDYDRDFSDEPWAQARAWARGRVAQRPLTRS